MDGNNGILNTRTWTKQLVIAQRKGKIQGGTKFECTPFKVILMLKMGNIIERC